MKKTLLALGVAVVMTFGFAACGDDTEDCVCKVATNIADEGEEADLFWEDGTKEKLEFDGKCTDMTPEDLGQFDGEYYDVVDCTKK